MRLIDVDELVRDIDELSKDAGFYRPIYEGFKNCINSKQTIDAVPVVRCRECKFRSSWMMNRNLRYICPESGMFPNCENDFCSYGKRKGGDNND